jgi:MFS family permease
METARRTRYQVTFAVLAAGVGAFSLLQSMVIPVLSTVWTNNLVALLLGIGMYATFAFLPEFVQTPSAAGYGFGASIAHSGLMLLPSAITMFFVGMFAGSLARRLGGKVLVIAGCLIGSVSMALLAFAHGHEWEIYLSTAIMGVGFGLAFSSMTALVVGAVPPEQTGVASGMNANIRTIGGSIGAAVMASIVTAQLEPSGLPKEAGYTTGFAVMAAVLVGAVLAGLLIPSPRRLRQPAGQQASAEPATAEALAMTGDVVMGEAAAGETVATELGE